MKALHHKVNLIPIIAKADALTTNELVHMKHMVCKNEMFHGKNNSLKNEFEFRFSNKFDIIMLKSIKYLIVIQMKMKN